jgi:NAD(P)H-dependent FMN reductase
MPIPLSLIYGSTRDGRLCDTVVHWTAGQIERRGGFAVDAVDPGHPDVERAIAGRDDAARVALRRRIGRAEAFVVVTPEYNHSFPAPLKALIDATGAGWQAKPVAFVSYGGISGGLRAVEHLRHVLAELHAVGIRDGVSFANAWDRFDGDGRLIEPASAEEAAARMLGRLSWWAGALSRARAAHDYAQAVA